MRRRAIVFVRAHIAPERDPPSLTIAELATGLAEGGERVALLCLRSPADRLPGAAYERWEIPTLGWSPWGRGRLVLEAWFLLAAPLLAAWRHRGIRVVVTLDEPPGVGFAGVAARLASRGAARHVGWVLDMFAEEGHAGGRGGGLRLRRALADLPHRLAGTTVTPGACMRTRLLAKGARRVEVIPQWQDARRIGPRDREAAARRFGVSAVS